MFLRNAIISTLLFFGFLLAMPAKASLLYMDPSSGDYGSGDTFIVDLRLDNENECINAIDIKISFPTDLLRVVDVGKGESIISLWVGDPVLDNKNGNINFIGGIPAGYCGRIEGDPALSNNIAKIVFSVPAGVVDDQEVKNALISISDRSKVLLNDGLGTPDKVRINNAYLNIHSSPILAENEWLSELNEDNVPPESFDVFLGKDEDVFDGKYYIYFSTTDKQSGLDYFEVFEKGSWKRISSPYPLKGRINSQLKVRAIDKAGNERPGNNSFDAGAYPQDDKITYLIFLLLVVLVCIAAIFLRGVILSRKSNLENRE